MTRYENHSAGNWPNWSEGASGWPADETGGKTAQPSDNRADDSTQAEHRPDESTQADRHDKLMKKFEPNSWAKSQETKPPTTRPGPGRKAEKPGQDKDAEDLTRRCRGVACW